MYENKLKKKLAAGRKVLGCIVHGALPALVEIAALTGFDFVFIDAEHGPLSESQCEELIRAAEARDIVPLVRVRENDEKLILRYLDAGAMGIILPGLKNKAEAEAAVRAVKYHPCGDRGLSGTRSSDFGLTGSLKEYVRYANEQTMVVVVIENPEAVANMAEILSVDGLDAAIIGASDLAQSLGFPGETDRPEVWAAFDRAVAAGLPTGKPVGAVVRGGETSRDYFSKGLTIALTTSYGLLAGASKSFVAAGRS